jgi:uracil-DNA glycosylase
MNLNKTLDSFVIIKNSNEKIVNENENNIIKRKETSPEKKTEKKSKKINSNNNNSTIEINSKEEQQKNSSKEQKNNSSKEKNNNNSSNNNTNSSKENNIINNYPNLKFYPTYTSFISCLSSWQEPLSNFISPPSNKTMLFIYNFIKNEYETKTIFPPKNQIFSAFQQTPFSSLKVVIIGQDPYPNPNDAMGLSFSVNKSQAIPPSLMNIYKCLENDKKINFKKPSHGDLTFWAKQGVFLLNSTLTVECRKANSHQKNSKWNEFTDFVIKVINKNKEHVVFLLWGNFAIGKKKFIDENKHFVVCNIHPSPLAAKFGKFWESKQFSLCNEYLKKFGIKEIDWQIK